MSILMKIENSTWKIVLISINHKWDCHYRLIDEFNMFEGASYWLNLLWNIDDLSQYHFRIFKIKNFWDFPWPQLVEC